MIVIVDYKAGNVTSLMNALTTLGAQVEVSSNPEVVKRADKIIFPGQGAAGAGMTALKERNLVEVLQKTTVPFLGICLGMQLLFNYSEEADTQCLGILPGRVERFKNTSLKIPQMGWNMVKQVGDSRLFKGVADETFFYFANSYRVSLNESITGLGLYGEPFCASIQKDNFYGVQFHPEKSGPNGLKVLSNFLAL